MMSVPRAVLKNNPQNNQRLQFPVSGEFGCEEPVGRKKYSSQHSPIHKLIFNHQIDLTTLNSSEFYNRSYSVNPENRSLALMQKERSNYSVIGNYSPKHSQQKIKMGSPSLNEREETYRYLPRQYSQQQSPNLDLNRSYGAKEHDIDGIMSMLVDSRAKNPRGYPGKKDSLDLLLNPIKVYEPMINKSKEKALDDFIRYRSKNPTFLNSQI